MSDYLDIFKKCISSSFPPMLGPDAKEVQERREKIAEETEKAWEKLQKGELDWMLWFNDNVTSYQALLTMQALIARLAKKGK